MSEPAPLAASRTAQADPRLHPEALYVHLPFCEALCTYCDFAREIYSDDRPNRYLAALERELQARIARLGAPFAPRTIFLGGGTPTALSETQLERFFDLLERHVDYARVEEFTAEANPGSADTAKLALLKRRGVNRASFGVQSFQPHLLQLLGRIHGAKHGGEAVRRARDAGFQNVTIDLMHGLPTQSLDDLKKDLDAALALGTEHLSAYGLIYEKGTPLTEASARGRVARLAPEEEGAHYRLVMETLGAGGLPQYEISNYAKPGREARHNLVYWRNEAYLGIGVSAAGCVHGERTVNHRAVDAYLHAVEAGEDPAAEREVLDASAKARESLVLALRLCGGLEPADFRARWGLDPATDAGFQAAFRKHAAAGLMERTAAGRYRITREGFPVADAILCDFV